MKATMLAMLLPFLVLILPCMGFQQASGVQDSMSSLIGSGLSPNKVRVTDAIEAIIKTMDQVEKLPSCQKLASQALLNTCSEIDHASTLSTDDGIDVMLERSKSIYATRLAICELVDANANIPPSCSSYRPVNQAQKHNVFRNFITHGTFSKPNAQRNFDDGRDLDQCSLSLSSNPVWWTSYSNARQNAVLLCHSMRSELDKDEMIQKIRIILEATVEATQVMSDSNEKQRDFEQQWSEMCKGLKSFHLAVNSDLEIQKQIVEQWAKFHANIQDLDDNIQNLGRDVDQIRKTSSHVTSDLHDHRILIQTVQADITQHFGRVLDTALQIDRSHDNSLASASALERQVQENHNLLTQNIENQHLLNQRFELLSEVIMTITDNATDAANAISEWQKDISSLPTKVLHGVLEASVLHLPSAFSMCLTLIVVWCLCTAAIDKSGIFRPMGSMVASIGLAIAFTWLIFEVFQACDLPTSCMLNIVGIVLVAILVCRVWYQQQAAWDRSSHSDIFDHEAKHPTIPSSQERPSIGSLLP